MQEVVEYTGMDSLLGDSRHKNLSYFFPSFWSVTCWLYFLQVPNNIYKLGSIIKFPLGKNKRFHCSKKKKVWKHGPCPMTALKVWRAEVTCSRAQNLLTDLRLEDRVWGSRSVPFGISRWHKELSWKEGLREQAVTDGFHLLCSGKSATIRLIGCWELQANLQPVLNIIVSNP